MASTPTDRQIVERLAKIVGIESLDWCVHYSDKDTHDETAFDLDTGNYFDPLSLLDDARLAEDKIREMGLSAAYAIELKHGSSWREFKASDVKYLQIENCIYKTARQRCEAMYRVLEQEDNHEAD